VNRAWRGTAPLERLASIASGVFIADFASKQWALRSVVAAGESGVVHGWHLAVINNTHLGWGIESSGTELPLTAFLTLVITVLVLRICDPLTEVDANAPAVLGLLVGAGAANLADAFLPPHGVVDFIAFTTTDGFTTSFNVADVVLATGLLLSGRTMWRIIQTMRGRVMPSPRHTHEFFPGALPMRDRLLVSGGHALLAMCAFIWLYSMAIAWTPDAGRSAPNSLLCGVGVFAIAFVVSQGRLRVAERRTLLADVALGERHPLERLVLDGSVPAFAAVDTATSPRSEPTSRTPAAARDELSAPADGPAGA
jgi:lipoprotein signal peptidase